MTIVQFVANANLAWFLLGELVLRQGTQAKRWTAGSDDRGTTRMMLAAYIAAAIVLNLSWLRALPVPPWLAWVGLIVSLGGTALRLWSMLVLGRFYSRTLTVANDHNLVSEGPYALVRHPGYAGGLLIWVGGSLAIGYAASTAVVALILIVVYTRRISVEEQMLARTLGQPYEAYRARTSRLIPGVW